MSHDFTSVTPAQRRMKRAKLTRKALKCQGLTALFCTLNNLYSPTIVPITQAAPVIDPNVTSYLPV